MRLDGLPAPVSSRISPGDDNRDAEQIEMTARGLYEWASVVLMMMILMLMMMMVRIRSSMGVFNRVFKSLITGENPA